MQPRSRRILCVFEGLGNRPTSMKSPICAGAEMGGFHEVGTSLHCFPVCAGRKTTSFLCLFLLDLFVRSFVAWCGGLTTLATVILSFVTWDGLGVTSKAVRLAILAWLAVIAALVAIVHVLSRQGCCSSLWRYYHIRFSKKG